MKLTLLQELINEAKKTRFSFKALNKIFDAGMYESQITFNGDEDDFKSDSVTWDVSMGQATGTITTRMDDENTMMISFYSDLPTAGQDRDLDLRKMVDPDNPEAEAILARMAKKKQVNVPEPFGQSDEKEYNIEGKSLDDIADRIDDFAVQHLEHLEGAVEEYNDDDDDY